MTSLRIAVLAPVSWRVPPRHYGPWEQFASLLTEGLVARGVDVTLFATADSITSGRLASVVARGYSEDRGGGAQGRRVPPHRARLRARRRVRRDPQQLRLPPVDLQRARRHARPDDDPRVLVGADPAGLPALQRHRLLRRDQRRGPASEPRLPRHDPSRHRYERLLAAPDSRRLPALLREDPSGQGHRGGDRRRRRVGSAARDRGDRSGPDVLRRARRPAARRASGSPSSGRSARASGRRSSAARTRCCT